MADWRNDAEYRELSAKMRQCIAAGDMLCYSATLKQAAETILKREGHHIDRMKFLMLAFYVDLSGVGDYPRIEEWLCNSISDAATNAGYSRYQIDELYMDVVRSDVTPSHIMTVSDSLYILQLCLSGKYPEAEEICKKLTGES